MVVVRMTEMYDMATTKNKIGLIGIHTPSADGMAKRWKGLFDNHRFYKILGVDVKIACASILPADPLQVGVESGDIAPQDMMNPLLYCTMTNEGWNALVNRLYALSSSGAGGIDTGSVRGIPSAFPNLSDSEQELLYYQMLSSDKFRKAMPQNGLSMHNVKPLVHQVVSTYGQSGNPNAVSQQGIGTAISGVGGSGAPTSGSLENNQFIRGKSMAYPRLPCSLPGSTGSATDFPVPNGVPILDVYAPLKTFCACIVLPPAKLNEFYFRMLVTWRIAFIQPCTMLEKVQATQLGDTSDIYYRDYNFVTSKELDADQLNEDDRTDSVNSVDALNMAPQLVMEK